ncbi:MAG: CinA family protein [Bacteroidia bacterium]
MTKEIAAEIGKILIAKDKTLAVAESCTGGFISHSITINAGSSAYFKGGVVAYDNTIKQFLLHVSAETLKNFGAVSVETAREMAAGALKNFNADYALSTTGIAGPTGETPGKPIGTVCIGFATKEKVVAEKFQFNGTREEVIQQSANKALDILLKELSS